MATNSSGSARKAVALLLKDIKSEIRTRYAINAIAMFAVVTVFAVSFAIRGAGLSIELQASLLWIVIYFSSLSGLAQSFVKEEESKTATALKLYSSAEVVFAGKLLFNLLLLFGLNLITIPLFAVFIGFDIANYAMFFTILLIGSIGLAVVTTFVAAIISKASVKGALFAVLSFPLILPLLVEAISGTKKSLVAELGFEQAQMEIQVLLSYLVVMAVLSFLLIDAVWND
jgi:heme exporter protein B